MTMFEAKSAPAERVVRVGCPAHNCGGRCLLKAHIRDGVIVRLETDDRPDVVADPQLRACTRGRAYLRRQYHPDRLRHPLRRVGARGAGRFERIGWDEALDLLAGQIRRVGATYGNGALFVPYGTGSYSQTSGSQTARRLLNLYGACLGIWNSYSWGAINVATPTVYGTVQTGNQRQDWLNARYILMWSWNPAEMRDGTNSEYFLKLARERGARVVCLDPRLSMSAASLADEWVPIRPGTDAAMMTAMAHVILTEGLHDAEFVPTHCQGASFFLTAGHLGALAAALALLLALGPTPAARLLGLLAATALAAELWLEADWRARRRMAAARVEPGLHPAPAGPAGARRATLLLMALALGVSLGLPGEGGHPAMIGLALAAAMAAGVAGRAAFYRSYARTGI
jgi:anaerobic selenocysteine-containing dehydrogenase